MTVDDEVQTNIPKADSKDSDGNYYKVGVSCDNNIQGEWDYNAWTLKLDNVINGTKCRLEFTSTMTATERDNIIKQGVAIRRNTYRGKDITEYKNLPEDNPMNLYKQISSGRFDDIYVGDYIQGTNGIKWLIADLDNYLNQGCDPLIIKVHHATIIPDIGLGHARMNEEATTIGGYAGSEMVTTTLGTIEEVGTATGILGTYIYPDFGEHIIKYNNLLTRIFDPNSLNYYATRSDIEAVSSWRVRYLDLMSEVNVYGTIISSSSQYDIGIDNRQYAIFQLRPELINQSTTGNMIAYWLKAIFNENKFLYASNQGLSASREANFDGIGIRPRFLID